MQPKLQSPVVTFLASFKRLCARAIAMHRQRAQWLQLTGMSEHELKDLGIGRSEVPQLLRRRPGAAPGIDCARPRRPRAARHAARR